MILAREDIIDALKKEHIRILPKPTAKSIGPCSIDLHLDLGMAGLPVRLHLRVINQLRKSDYDRIREGCRALVRDGGHSSVLPVNLPTFHKPELSPGNGWGG